MQMSVSNLRVILSGNLKTVCIYYVKTEIQELEIN